MTYFDQAFKMGDTPKKYHITDSGDIFRINEDGSFTSMGNAEYITSLNHKEISLSSSCQLRLESAGKQKLFVIKIICLSLNCSLKEAKKMVDNSPYCLSSDISISEAENIRAKLERVGAKVSIISSLNKTNGN